MSSHDNKNSTADAVQDFPDFTSDEVLSRGQQFYERELKARLLQEHKGDHVAINVATYDYAVDKNPARASQKLRESDPNVGEHTYLVRVGYFLTYRMVSVYREEVDHA